MFVSVCSALICEKYVLLPACLQVFPWLAPTRGAAQLSFLGITATTPSPPPPAPAPHCISSPLDRLPRLSHCLT